MLVTNRRVIRRWCLDIFRRGTNVKPEVDAWIAAQRLNRLAQAAVAEAMGYSLRPLRGHRKMSKLQGAGIPARAWSRLG